MAAGVRATIATTAANLTLIPPHPNLHLLSLPFPPSVLQNLTHFPTPDLTPDFIAAIAALQTPFTHLLTHLRPDCIVSDVFYPWTSRLAAEFQIPRISFHGTSSFSAAVFQILSTLRPHDAVAGDEEPFVLPQIPHRINLTKSQLPGGLKTTDDVLVRIAEAEAASLGVVMNTFYELEPDYADWVKDKKVWRVGPVSLCNQEPNDCTVRGGAGGSRCDLNDWLNWLDGKEPGSVLYVCFGSLGQFSRSQFREIAVGLEASGHHFIWVVRDHIEEVGGKGLVIRGWAPQILLLNHRAIGGFMTHCGWNSCLEAVAAGVPMVTWPLFAEQFFNERLVVDVLRIGVSVGAKVCSGREEERGVVSGEEVRKAVVELMGGGEEGEERRRRAEEEGGSSWNDMSCLVRELMEIKAGKAEVGGSLEQS